MDWVGSSGGVCPRCVMMTGRCHTVCWGGGTHPPRSEWVHEESVGVLLLAGTVCNQFRRRGVARWTGSGPLVGGSRPPESPDDPGVVPCQVGILRRQMLSTHEVEEKKSRVTWVRFPAGAKQGDFTGPRFESL